jgi:hypothetical protein
MHRDCIFLGIFNCHTNIWLKITFELNAGFVITTVKKIIFEQDFCFSSLSGLLVFEEFLQAISRKV